jgi:hypothetical protein
MADRDVLDDAAVAWVRGSAEPAVRFLTGREVLSGRCCRRSEGRSCGCRRTRACSASVRCGGDDQRPLQKLARPLTNRTRSFDQASADADARLVQQLLPPLGQLGQLAGSGIGVRARLEAIAQRTRNYEVQSAVVHGSTSSSPIIAKSPRSYDLGNRAEGPKPMACVSLTAEAGSTQPTGVMTSRSRVPRPAATVSACTTWSSGLGRAFIVSGTSSRARSPAAPRAARRRCRDLPRGRGRAGPRALIR